METRININNTFKKALSRFHITTLHINNDILTMLNYNKKYVIKRINKAKLGSFNTEINYNRFDDLEISSAIEKFINTISKTFTKEELILFYRNIPTLTVERVQDDRYHILKNKIEISKISNIYHELFHLATTIHTKDSEICGFQQYNVSLDDGIGNGLNEGYTELLAERYFGKEDHNADSYRYEMIVARAFEYIISKNKMQSLYINADLSGFITELKRYTSNKEIFCLLNRLDFICNNRYKEDLNHFRENKVIEYIEYINSFLITTYIDKLYSDNISKEEFDKYMNKFLNLFTGNIALNNKIYDLEDITNNSSKSKKNL